MILRSTLIQVELSALIDPQVIAISLEVKQTSYQQSVPISAMQIYHHRAAHNVTLTEIYMIMTDRHIQPVYKHSFRSQPTKRTVVVLLNILSIVVALFTNSDARHHMEDGSLSVKRCVFSLVVTHCCFTITPDSRGCSYCHNGLYLSIFTGIFYCE